MGVTVAMMTIVALAGSGIYYGLKTLENYNPGRKKIQKDLLLLKTDLQPFLNELVPWSDEEMAQLSLNTIKKKRAKRIVTTTKGIFTTIYHEPLIAWAYRKYVSSKENALIYARTSDHEFIYREKKDLVEIVIDNELVGRLNSNGSLLSLKGNKTLANISKSAGGHGVPILVHGVEVGRLSDPSKVSSANPRAFQVIGKMNDEQEQLFLALAILEFIKGEI